MSGFGNCAFNKCSFRSQSYTGIWRDSFTFDYEAGATVYINPVLTASIPSGTKVVLYASEDEITWTELTQNELNFVTFVNGVSGNTLLYIKIEMYSYLSGLTPILSSLAIDIHQETSLYTVAVQVLSDALTSRKIGWKVDTELQKYKIPYGWIKTKSHRKALAQIAEAAGGVAYQDRYGNVRVQAGSYISRLSGNTPTDLINSDRILKLSSPVEEIANKVSIVTMPYVEQASQEVWKLSGDAKLDAGETKTFSARYSDFDAVVDAVATLTGAGATITVAVYKYGGADITVHATSAVTITLSISGKPLVVSGSRSIQESDGDSIRRYGTKTLEINENNLIQDSVIAEAIAEDIIKFTKNPNRAIEIDWRGDPTDELGDVVSINGMNTVVVSQEFNYNGTLSASAKVRRF